MKSYQQQSKVDDSSSVFDDIIGNLKESPAFQLSLSSKELFHSNFIAWLVQQYPCEMARVFELDCHKIEKVRREKYNYDLLFIDDKRNCVVVEVKVKSLPLQKQLQDYKEKLHKANDLKEYGIKNAECILLTLSEPSFGMEKSVSGWETVLFKEFVEKLLTGLLETNSIKCNYHAELIGDYINFVNNLIRVTEECSIQDSEDSIYLPSEKRVALLGIRIDDLVQKVRFSQMEMQLRNRFSGRIEFASPINQKRKNNDPILKKGDISIKAGFTRTDAILDLKCVYSLDPFIILGFQLQGKQLRCVVEMENKIEAERKFKELESEWCEPFLKELQELGPFEEWSPKEKNKDQGFCRFGGFIYKYVKVPEETKVDDILNAYELAIGRIQDLVIK